MFTTIEGSSADELWVAALKLFEDGDFTSQASRAGETKEILHASLCLQNPRDRWILSRSPAINPAYALVEVIWILKGRRDSAFLNYFNRKLPQFAGNGETYHGAYGFRLRSNRGIDQMERAYQALKSNPETRQVVLQIWETELDLPGPDGVPVAADVPCNICSFLKIRNGKLEWTQIMRSNDLFRGLPYNIVQFTTLHEIMAGWLNVGVGAYHHFSDSLHLYQDTVLSKSHPAGHEYLVNRDYLGCTFEETSAILQQVEDLVHMIINPKATPGDIVSAFGSLQVPEAWKNTTSIIVAEGLRRRGAVDHMDQIVESGTNPVLKLLFNKWVARTTGEVNSSKF